MDRDAFLARVAEYRDDGWRLALINATAILPSEELEGGAFEVSWSFAKDARFEHIRERVLPGDEVPSISASFEAAFLYENEMRELFGINVTGIAVDLRGQLYKTATKVPFSPRAIRERLEATGRLDEKKPHGAGGAHGAGAAAAHATPQPAPSVESPS